MYSDSPSHRSSTSRYASKLLGNSFVEDSFSNTFVTVNQSFENNSDETAHLEPLSILFEDFLEAKRKYPKNDQLFDLLQEYEDLCSDNLTVLLNLVSKTRDAHSLSRCENMLRNERNTWRLLRVLYEDRFKNEVHDENMQEENVTRLTDKEVVDALYDRDSNLRQMQLVIDWLEQNESDALNEDETFKLEFFAEGPYYWENTLHQIINRRRNLSNLKPNEREFCAEMDPDAPFRSAKDLNDVDVEDENRLMKYIFRYVRAGKLNEAKQIANKMGYHWLVAALNGWMLHHDHNFDISETNEVRHCEGNANRDIWKYVCWANSNNESKSVYEKAVFSALSGNLKMFLQLCPRWTDKLWAYSRVSVDVQIERELRETEVDKQVTTRSSGIICSSSRTTVDLPADYWNGLRTFEEIFRELDGQCFQSNSVEEKYHQQLQKAFILGDVSSALSVMLDFKQNYSQTSHEMYWQMFRCFTHLVLFLRQFGAFKLQSDYQVEICVLETYITYLIDLKKIELVAVYVSCLPQQHNQIVMYSKLMQNITDPSERKLCLKYAKQMDLDIELITKNVVESIRKFPSSDTLEQFENNYLETHCFVNFGISTTLEDRRKIESLDWLFLNTVQYSELLIQGNNLMRYFELLDKVDAARDTFRKLPVDIIDGVMKPWKRSGFTEVSRELNNAIKEYLCHKAYFQAYESFDEWIKFYHTSKPKEPSKPVTNRFTDKVAFEHSQKQFENELQQWKLLLAKQAKLTAEKIYNVLVFPDSGWMIEEKADEFKSSDETRTNQLALLRKKVIPQLTFVLQSLLHTSGDMKSSLQIADVIACEQYALYKEFSGEELKNILKK
ncbi:nuclear pore complex protein Nup107-like isoform X1, partial [Leptotrombidium deliense]